MSSNLNIDYICGLLSYQLSLPMKTKETIRYKVTQMCPSLKSREEKMEARGYLYLGEESRRHTEDRWRTRERAREDTGNGGRERREMLVKASDLGQCTINNLLTPSGSQLTPSAGVTNTPQNTH